MTMNTTPLHQPNAEEMDFPSKPIQRLMFFMPYVFISLASVVLLINEQHTKPNIGWWLGFVNLTMLLGYILGVVGNHYLKILSFFINLPGLLALLASREFSSAAALVLLYWVPATLFVWVSLQLPSISEILPGKLYLSNSCAATSQYWPERCGATHILDLSGKGEHKSACKVKRLRVTDSLGSHGSLAAVIEEGVAFVKAAMQQNGIVLVHCYAGQSRSPGFVVYYLMIHQTMSLDEAYNFCQQQRPIIDISSDHMGTLRDLDSTFSKKSS